ncbi:MAG: hypothetical protein CMQ45_01050 [Gammaproteobacteria bacterium]|nr:hypothetical protein [Gammaproteobacteria bacterium]
MGPDHLVSWLPAAFNHSANECGRPPQPSYDSATSNIVDAIVVWALVFADDDPSKLNRAETLTNPL